MRILNRWNQLILPSILLTNGLLADSEMPLERVTTLPNHSATPVVAPAVENTLNVTTAADFIWWKTYLANMEYAWAGVVDLVNVPRTESVAKGNIKNPDFDFAPGFKVGLGLTFKHDGWDLYGRYTWLNTHSTTHTSGAQNVGLVATFAFDGLSHTALPLTSASVKWEQEFSVIDLELGRNFFISKRLTLRPHVGLKADWIEEEFTDIYSTSFSRGREVGFTVHRNERVWGIGIRGGLDTVWHFTRSWGLYGDVAVTALWSDFHTTLKGVANSNITNLFLEEGIFNTYQKIQQVMPVLEAGLGLIYQLWFHQERNLFFAKVGWEGQIWFDYNQIIQPPLAPKCGSLSLQGLTVEVGFTF
jgi:hypothetical protein